MASPAIDRLGNIAIGCSFGGTPHFAGQRFAARLSGDPPGRLTLHEAVLAEGEGAQAAMRWEDYTQTAMNPSDDCTFWYAGDYIKNELRATRPGSAPSGSRGAREDKPRRRTLPSATMCRAPAIQIRGAQST